MTFSKDELQVIVLGLELYRGKVSKLMKDSEKIKTGQKPIKQAFLETEQLINRIVSE